jgi:hypothetical protein
MIYTRLFPIEDVATYLQKSTRNVYKVMRILKIKPTMKGRMRMFSEGEVRQLDAYFWNSVIRLRNGLYRRKGN